MLYYELYQKSIYSINFSFRRGKFKSPRRLSRRKFCRSVIWYDTSALHIDASRITTNGRNFSDHNYYSFNIIISQLKFIFILGG